MPSSPFPAIADYAFLSDCHTGALVAPDGTVEWLCPPRFDSPSVFAAVLDRSAGGWRFGPSNMGKPVGRRYEPGTNIVETTWMTPTGWMIVRDALIVGRWRVAGIDQEVGPHAPSLRLRRPPRPRPHRALRPRLRPDRAGLRAGLRLRPAARQLDAARPRAGRRRRHRRRDDPAPALRRQPRHRGRHRPRPPPPRRGRGLLLRALVVVAARRADDLRGGRPSSSTRTSRFWRTWLASGDFPDHRWREQLQRSALVLKGLTYMPTGAMVAALTTSLPETPGRRAQLGLPLHLDARRDLHPAGAPRPRPELGGRRLHPVRRRRRAQRRRSACRSCTGSAASGSFPRRPSTT